MHLKVPVFGKAKQRQDSRIHTARGFRIPYDRSIRIHEPLQRRKHRRQEKRKEIPDPFHITPNSRLITSFVPPDIGNKRRNLHRFGFPRTCDEKIIWRDIP